MKLNFSIIVPVYNRPNEIDALLESLTKQHFSDDFEVLIIEDGSEIAAENIVKKYQSQYGDIKDTGKQQQVPLSFGGPKAEA